MGLQQGTSPQAIAFWRYRAAVTAPPKERSRMASQRDSAASKAITHESIAEDLAAFEESGGEMEVLGTTATLKHVGVAETHERRAVNRPALWRTL